MTINDEKDCQHDDQCKYPHHQCDQHLNATKCLAPESALKEPDENWNWDVVFAQVSGELHKEWYSDGDKDQEKIVVSSGESNLQADIEGPGTSNRITKERPYTAFNRFPV